MKQERKYDIFMNPLVGASLRLLRETAALKMSCGERKHVRIKMNCTRHTVCAKCQRTCIESSSQCCNIVIPAITFSDLSFTPAPPHQTQTAYEVFHAVTSHEKLAVLFIFRLCGTRETSVGSVRRAAAVRRPLRKLFRFLNQPCHSCGGKVRCVSCTTTYT